MSMFISFICILWFVIEMSRAQVRRKAFFPYFYVKERRALWFPLTCNDVNICTVKDCNVLNHSSKEEAEEYSTALLSQSLLFKYRAKKVEALSVQQGAAEGFQPADDQEAKCSAQTPTVNCCKKARNN